MNEKTLTFQFMGIWFDGTVCLMVLLACLIVFLFVFICSRNLQMKPKGKQNVLEWVVDFVGKIISDNMPSREVNNFHLMGFTFFMFVIVCNTLGLVTKIVLPGDVSLWKSPTADPIVTLTLALMVILLTNFFSAQRFGFKGYVKISFMNPMALLMPVKLIEEFTNVLTMGLRVYGNIYAGEVLLTLIASMVTKLGWLVLPLAIPLEMVWIGFSLFIGAIQAYVFVTLTMVYLDHKTNAEE